MAAGRHLKPEISAFDPPTPENPLER